jgi:hypothetical protein
VETIPFYVKRGIARTHANPNYGARGIILFTCDMYLRERIIRLARQVWRQTTRYKFHRSRWFLLSAGGAQRHTFIFGQKRGKPGGAAYWLGVEAKKGEIIIPRSCQARFRLMFCSIVGCCARSAETKECTSIYLKSLTMASFHVSAHISKKLSRFLIIQQMNII